MFHRQSAAMVRVPRISLSCMPLQPMLNFRLILCGLIFLAYLALRTIIEPHLPPAAMLASLAEILVVVLAGRPDEEFVAALEDENDGNAHSGMFKSLRQGLCAS